MADLPLWEIENKKIYELEEFDMDQERYREVARAKLLSYHKTILETLENMYEVFRNDGRDVQIQWARFVDKIDLLVEDALRASVKRSLQEISKSINGEGKNRDNATEVHPLFKVNVILDSQRVDFSPTLPLLEETVNKAAREM